MSRSSSRSKAGEWTVSSLEGKRVRKWRSGTIRCAIAVATGAVAMVDWSGPALALRPASDHHEQSQAIQGFPEGSVAVHETDSPRPGFSHYEDVPAIFDSDSRWLLTIRGYRPELHAAHLDELASLAQHWSTPQDDGSIQPLYELALIDCAIDKPFLEAIGDCAHVWFLHLEEIESGFDLILGAFQSGPHFAQVREMTVMIDSSIQKAAEQLLLSMEHLTTLTIELPARAERHNSAQLSFLRAQASQTLQSLVVRSQLPRWQVSDWADFRLIPSVTLETPHLRLETDSPRSGDDERIRRRAGVHLKGDDVGGQLEAVRDLRCSEVGVITMVSGTYLSLELQEALGDMSAVDEAKLYQPGNEAVPLLRRASKSLKTLSILGLDPNSPVWDVLPELRALHHLKLELRSNDGSAVKIDPLLKLGGLELTWLDLGSFHQPLEIGQLPRAGVPIVSDLLAEGLSWLGMGDAPREGIPNVRNLSVFGDIPMELVDAFVERSPDIDKIFVRRLLCDTADKERVRETIGARGDWIKLRVIDLDGHSPHFKLLRDPMASVTMCEGEHAPALEVGKQLAQALGNSSELWFAHFSNVHFDDDTFKAMCHNAREHYLTLECIELNSTRANWLKEVAARQADDWKSVSIRLWVPNPPQEELVRQLFDGSDVEIKLLEEAYVGQHLDLRDWKW
jgi:hypothetical protein